MASTFARRSTLAPSAARELRSPDLGPGLGWVHPNALCNRTPARGGKAPSRGSKIQWKKRPRLKKLKSRDLKIYLPVLPALKLPVYSSDYRAYLNTFTLSSGGEPVPECRRIAAPPIGGWVRLAQ